VKIFRLKSFCKININLRVLKKLKNGYHSIQSFIVFSDIFDLVTVSQIKNPKDKIKFYGKFKKGIDNKFNTITKLLNLLRKSGLIKGKFFSVKIKKNIPHGSGLGGGSSNAATLLNFLNSKKKLNLSNKKLKSIGSKVGSDVPVLLNTRSALLTGKIGQIKKINNNFKFDILIVYPNLICSTKKIYEKNKNFSLPLPVSAFNFKSKKTLINFLKNEKNDLQNPVTKLYPKIRTIIRQLSMMKGCYFSRITGSGSACVAIFSNMSGAIAAQKLIKLKYPKYWTAVSKTI
jgi:4-diphosphocytidyl-2-C-methyl-D-erythritol kinase